MKAECCIDLPKLNHNNGQLEEWIAGLEAAHTELKRLIADLPAAALSWQPILTTESIGALLLHIAYTEKYWLTERVGSDEEKYLWNDNGNHIAPPAPHQPLSWYLDLIDSVHASSLRALQELPSLNHIYTRRSEDGKTEHFALRWILWHLIEHASNHRGQIALLKRWYQDAHAPVYA